MRPQLFAAEYGRQAAMQGIEAVASMRPQLFAAEYGGTAGCTVTDIRASMRPQLFAAEYIMESMVAKHADELQ